MKKYLTIGSMCDLKGDEDNTKYLIVGYQKNEKDYEAVLFPGGTTENGKFIYFNAEDIDEVYDLGYKDKVAIEYLKNIFTVKRIKVNDEKNIVKDEQVENELKNYKFDENGFVIIDESISSKPAEVVKNYHFTEDGVVVLDETTTNNKVENVSGYKFDENGFVISDEVVTNKKTENTSSYQFDENGFVVSDEAVTSNKVENVSGYKFDENGFVISN